MHGTRKFIDKNSKQDMLKTSIYLLKIDKDIQTQN